MATEEEFRQVAACLGCGLAWKFPEELPAELKEEFPLPSGPWRVACPNCGGVIWVTEGVDAEDAEGAESSDDGVN